MSPRIRDWSEPPSSREDRPPTEARLYSESVRALARRELTSLQLRQKLVAAGGRHADIDAVLARLTTEGALDDRRAARLYAQTAFRQRKRPRARIHAELERLGVAAPVAREIVDDVCSAEIEQQRLEHAIIHALRGTRREHRDQDARRLFASFIRQGFEPEAVRLGLARAGIDTASLDEG